MELGRFGIWSGPLRRAPIEAAIEAAREIERLGFGAAWLPSGALGLLQHTRRLLEGTKSLVVGTSILNIYTEPDPNRVASDFASIDEAHPGRLLLGVGVGHRESVDRESPGRYQPPLGAISEYLDGLDRAATPVPGDRRALAALGPRMVRLSAERSVGALPYLTTPGHTREARSILGPGPLLVAEQKVILDNDPRSARALARDRLASYLQMSNYRNNFRRMGFTESDLAGEGSDRLVDDLVAWGDVDSVVLRLDEHRSAGADHVAIQVLVADRGGFPVEDWTKIALAVN